VYPPLVAYVMQALAAVPFQTIATVWVYTSVPLMLLGVYLTFIAYLPAWNRPLVWAALLVALCAFEPLRYGFWLGQTTALIYPLVMAAVVLQRRDQPLGAGLTLACATFIKWTPAVLLLVWLWRGPRRAVIWCGVFLAALWMASLATMGIETNAAYLARLAAISRVDLVAYNNQSLIAVLSRFWFPASAWQDWQMYQTPRAALLASWTLLLVGTAIAAAGLYRLRAEPDRVTRYPAEGIAFLLMLLAPNIAWTHYFVFLLPVVAILVAMSDRTPIPALAATVALALCSRPLLMEQNRQPSVSSPWLVSTPALAALLLGAVLSWLALTRPRTQDEARGTFAEPV
jgi:hypothetical protein